MPEESDPWTLSPEQWVQLCRAAPEAVAEILHARVRFTMTLSQKQWDELVRFAHDAFVKSLSDNWTPSPERLSELDRVAQEAADTFGIQKRNLPFTSDRLLNEVWSIDGTRVELGGQEGSVTAPFKPLDLPSTERGYECTINVARARLYHATGLLFYNLQIRRKPSAPETVATTDAPPKVDATSDWTPQMPPPIRRYGGADDVVALEVLTEKYGVSLPIPGAELAAYQSRCAAWATDWTRGAANRNRMEGKGDVDAKQRRLRDAMHRVLSANVRD
jgi:hypothetical protein